MTYSLRTRPSKPSNVTSKPDTKVAAVSKVTKKRKLKKNIKDVTKDSELSHSDSEDPAPQEIQRKTPIAKTKAAPKSKAASKAASLNISNLSLYTLASRQLDRGSINVLAEPIETSGDDAQTEGMAGRDEERKQLSEFWEKHVLSKMPGSLYISGQPGTGKTALLKEWVSKHHPKRTNPGKGAIHVIHFNCVAVSGPRGFLPALLDLIPIKTKETFEDPIEQLRNLITATSGFVVLILDELDHLLNTTGGGAGQEILYQIFELVHISSSKLSVIGVANDLNLTDRFLPRLRARGFEPMRIQFQSYTSEQITTILKRLISPIEKEALRRAASSTTDFKPLFQPLALELCAKKVANASGDLRRALDLFRQAVNIAETEATSDTLVQITAVHIIKAEQASAGSPVIKMIKALPPNAQVLLAAILHLVSRKAPLVISQLYEEYSRICKDSGLFEALSINEVGALLDNLETNGLVERNIDSKGFKGTPSRRVGISSIKGRSPSLSLLIVESDLWKALKANDLVCTIIPPEKKT